MSGSLSLRRAVLVAAIAGLLLSGACASLIGLEDAQELATSSSGQGGGGATVGTSTADGSTTEAASSSGEPAVVSSATTTTTTTTGDGGAGAGGGGGGGGEGGSGLTEPPGLIALGDLDGLRLEVDEAAARSVFLLAHLSAEGADDHCGVPPKGTHEQAVVVRVNRDDECTAALRLHATAISPTALTTEGFPDPSIAVAGTGFGEISVDDEPSSLFGGITNQSFAFSRKGRNVAHAAIPGLQPLNAAVIAQSPSNMIHLGSFDDVSVVSCDGTEGPNVAAQTYFVHQVAGDGCSPGQTGAGAVLAAASRAFGGMALYTDKSDAIQARVAQFGEDATGDATSTLLGDNPVGSGRVRFVPPAGEGAGYFLVAAKLRHLYCDDLSENLAGQRVTVSQFETGDNTGECRATWWDAAGIYGEAIPGYDTAILGFDGAVTVGMNLKNGDQAHLVRFDQVNGELVANSEASFCEQCAIRDVVLSGATVWILAESQEAQTVGGIEVEADVTFLFHASVLDIFGGELFAVTEL